MGWLRDYVDIDIPVEELADRLENTGTAVESIVRMGQELRNILAGVVLECGPHPRAGRLKLCRVDVGGGVSDIVCGAANVTAGMKVAVAVPGAVLQGGRRIEMTEIMGVASAGMLLSGAELGINDDAAGILELPPEVAPGDDIPSYLGMKEEVLELEITPNRPDCLSLIGVAREVAAIFGLLLTLPLPLIAEETPPDISGLAEVEIDDADLCSRYTARMIRGVTIGPSPLWMQARLRAAGVRPISNVVDITNYVMWECGQPLHAFDFSQVREGHIIVRRARPGERMVTLDGATRDLDPEMLLITDPAGPIALAGVMGGENSEVADDTTDILLESAHFEPTSIMRTSRMLGLNSEASRRFERGSDPSGTAWAADRAIELMRAYAGGRILQGTVDARPRVIAPVGLGLRVRRTSELLGVELDASTAADLLESIDIEIAETKDETGESVLQAVVPTFRPDLEREIDLVEEVARLYGYGRIPATLPASHGKYGRLSHEQRQVRNIRQLLVAAGLFEVVTYGFTSERLLERMQAGAAPGSLDLVRLRNPISEEMAVMRTTLLPGLLSVLDYNLRRRNTELGIFEIERVFLPRVGQELPEELLKVGCALGGLWTQKGWDRESQEVDFYTLKGIVEMLLRHLNVYDWELRRAGSPWLHPGKSAAVLVKGEALGEFGELKPGIAGAFEIKANTQVLEFDVAALLAAAAALPEFREIGRYPSMRRDIALVMDENIAQAEVEKVIRQTGGSLLGEIRLFDLYRGEQVEAGKKSIAYTLTYFSEERTLEESEVSQLETAILDALERELSITVRS